MLEAPALEIERDLLRVALCLLAVLPLAYTRSGTIPMAISTLIVDDERPARDELIYLLKGFPEIEVVAQGKNGLEAVSLIKEHDPDLVFLDVQMPGLDGFGVIKKLVERKLRIPQIVFATAFDNYAVHAFEVNAVDYVLKPFDKARIAKAVQRAKKMVEADTSPVERLETLVGQLGAGAPKRKAASPGETAGEVASAADSGGCGGHDLRVD